MSKQEIRQAGEISSFAEIVRKISSEIRGDSSLKNKLLLNKMKEISVNSKKLDYGINVDDVFWVKNQIIRREQVRESKDEEIVADIIATMILDETPGSSSKILDEYYSLLNKNKRASELDSKIQIIGAEKIHNDFFMVFDIIKSLLISSKVSFNSLIAEERTFDKVPRYFQIVFLALHKLIIKQSKKLTSIEELKKSLAGITSSVKLSQGGGNWSAVERDNSINAVSGIIEKHFVDNPEDPGIIKWSTQLETILQQSKTEQTNFDFKISFFNLGTSVWNDSVLKKIIKTLTSMANNGKKSIGYVIAGVADKKEDAEKLYNIDHKYKFIEYNDYYITGINYDIDTYGKGEDKYFQYITNKIDKIDFSQEYKDFILRNIKFLKYGDKMVMLFKVEGLNSPGLFEGKYYQRAGANVVEIQPSEFMSLMKRFG